MAGKRERGGDENEEQLQHDVRRLVRLVQGARAVSTSRFSRAVLFLLLFKAPDQRIANVSLPR